MPVRFAFLFFASIFSASCAGAQDLAHGQKVFKKCASCHMIGEGAKNRVGPNLTGVIGRPAGGIADYKYSKSMLAAGEAGLIWTSENVFAYLENPTRFLRSYLSDPKAKAKMTLRLKKEEDRRDVIAYLAGFSKTAQAEPLAVCVRNGSEHAHFFAVEAAGTGRKLAQLEPGATLCTDPVVAETPGVVSVYETEDALEGCSRLVIAGQDEALIKYVDFDRCFWSSNSG